LRLQFVTMKYMFVTTKLSYENALRLK